MRVQAVTELCITDTRASREQTGGCGGRGRDRRLGARPSETPPTLTPELPEAQVWEPAGVPLEAQVLTRELVSPKVPNL